MYTVFIRDKNQRIYSKITTTDKVEAFKNFAKTIYRKELYGRKLIAILKHKDSVKMFHRFDSPTDKSSIQEKLINLENILLIGNQGFLRRRVSENSFKATAWTKYKFPI